MEEEIPRKYSIAQKRALFFRFVEFNDPHFNDELKAKVRPLAARGEKSIQNTGGRHLLRTVSPTTL